MTQVCLVNLTQLDPRDNGGTSRIAREVSQLLAEWSQTDPTRKVVFVVHWQFAAGFAEWLGRDVFVVSYFFPRDADQICRIARPDIVISPQFGLSPFANSSVVPIPHIAGMPDALALDRPDLFSFLQRRGRQQIYRHLTQASAVVTLSEHAKQRLQHHLNIPPERIHVIPLGADALAENSSEAEKISLPERYVFYPANIWSHKRHDLLFRTMNVIWNDQPDLHLVLSGGRGVQSLQVVQELLRKYKCPPEKVIDFGFVTDAQLQHLYENAEALLFVSEYEGFGMPLLEAMRHGCPVICAPVSAIPEVVGDAALFVDSDRPEVWAEAFLRELPLRQNDLIRKGMARARRFTWHNTREKWKLLLEEFGLYRVESAEITMTCPLEMHHLETSTLLLQLINGMSSRMSRKRELLYLLRNLPWVQAVRREAHEALRNYVAM